MERYIIIISLPNKPNPNNGRLVQIACQSIAVVLSVLTEYYSLMETIIICQLSNGAAPALVDQTHIHVSCRTPTPTL